MQLLKEEAKAAPRERARLCLHQSEEDGVQEMLIVFCRGAQIRPHRTVNKSESIHVVEGRLKMLIFDDAGNVSQSFEMGGPGSGKSFMTRFTSGPWYTYVPLTDFVAIHEISRGPFEPHATVFPEWAPEDGPDLAKFIEMAAA